MCHWLRETCLSLQDFTDSAILAYECGYNEESLRAELRQLLAARAADIERGCGPQSGPLRFMQVGFEKQQLICMVHHTCALHVAMS